ncbi:predicted protein [Nematostella vectensis]|uniref:Potassium channel domain-containing protein n=1 Tax=Nematostella vectensis TaxID=45351 RepID=A7RKK2_NEMVE|nr:predicted protein [Nematostella vectensis]|eukprot:XP_001640065.1 predicted protein [Nematostella vectensis]
MVISAPVPLLAAVSLSCGFSLCDVCVRSYGDKCPRSIAGRCFSVVWILVGLVIVAVFMANITTALTSINVAQSYEIADMKIAAFMNSTEYEFAEKEGSEIVGYKTFQDMADALEKKIVDGILIDRYTAGSYVRHYHENKLKHSLISASHVQISGQQIGFVISSNRALKMTEECYFTHNGAIYGEDWWLTGLRTKALSYAKELLYASLGLLAGLFLVGFAVDFLRKRKIILKRAEDVRPSEGPTIPEDRLEVELLEGMRLLQEHFEKLEQLIKQRKSFNDWVKP